MSERTVPRPQKRAQAQRDVGSRGRWIALIVVLTAVFMQMLDTTITMVAIPSIQHQLKASFGEIQLVVAGYSLAFACVLITAGRLGDAVGRKRMFLIGMACFTLTSALCGAAPNALTLVIARLLQGASSGLMFPQVLSIIQVAYRSTTDRAKALSMYGAAIGLATVTGPVLGGSLIAWNLFGADWRLIFYVNVPIGLAALPIGLRVITETRVAGHARIDLPGAALVTTGLFLLVLPLVIGREQGWPTWTFVMLAASLPVLALFVWYEARLGRQPGSNPLMPTRLFRDRSFNIGLLLSLIFFAGVPSFFFVFFLTLQVGLGYSAVAAGAVTLAFAVMVGIASARSPAVVRHLGTWVLLVGSALLMIGMAGVMATIHLEGNSLHGYQLIPSLIVGGTGAGLFLAPCIGVILAGIKSEAAGAASGILATMQQVGAAIGIGIIGIIFFGLIGHNASASIAQAQPALRSALASAGLPPGQAQTVLTGFQTCFRDEAHSGDPQATPPSCVAMQRRLELSPASPSAKAAVQRAVLDQAAPTARIYDFTRSAEGALWWQVSAFALCCVLVLAMPKVKPTSPVPADAVPMAAEPSDVRGTSGGAEHLPQTHQS